MAGKYAVATEVTLDESFDCLSVYTLRAASRFDDVYPVVDGQNRYFFVNDEKNPFKIYITD